MEPNPLTRRAAVLAWLRAGLSAVDPEPLTREALRDRSGPATIIAIGKAAPAMCRGAAAALGEVDGLCVSDHVEEVPETIRMVVGDHPVPGHRSLRAGRLALELAPSADLALVSGGGSSLCEVPRQGLELDALALVHRGLVHSGVPIAEANVVRAALSEVKCGGLGPLPTYVLSDVPGGRPELVASGPTAPTSIEVEEVLSILERHRIELPPEIEAVLSEPVPSRPMPAVMEVVGDGLTAAGAVASAASARDRPSVVSGWLEGPIEDSIRRLVTGAGPGVTVAAGEPVIGRSGEGRGGRNTHAALLAALAIGGTASVFAAFATDGVDGSSRSAGAIVDGTTLSRGGDPHRAIETMDSATYLERSGDLLPEAPTGTNVADLWVMWRPVGLEAQPILTA